MTQEQNCYLLKACLNGMNWVVHFFPLCHIFMAVTLLEHILPVSYFSCHVFSNVHVHLHVQSIAMSAVLIKTIYSHAKEITDELTI